MKRPFEGLRSREPRERCDAMTVRWPSGPEETFADLEARQLLRIVAGRGLERRSLPGAGADPKG